MALGTLVYIPLTGPDIPLTGPVIDRSIDDHLNNASLTHPYLFFNDITDTPGYRYRTGSPWRDWESDIVNSADNIMQENFSDHDWPDDNLVSTRAQRALYLGLAYQITKNTSYAVQGREALLNLEAGYVPAKLNKAWQLRDYCFAYDWLQPTLDPKDDSIIRDKLAKLADSVYLDLNDNGTTRDYVTFADYHGQAYPDVGIAGMTLYDYKNPNGLPLVSGPDDWVKVGTEYLFVNDKLHDLDTSLIVWGPDGKDLSGAYKSYVVKDMIWLAQAYTHVYNRNFFDDYPMAKNYLIAETWDSLPDYYSSNFATNANMKWTYHAAIINLLDQDTKEYVLKYYDDIVSSRTLPYAGEMVKLDYPMLYLTYDNYSTVSRSDPPFTSHLENDSSFQVFRGSWAMDSSWLSFITWNANTHSNRNMAHHDQLSFEYYSKGDLLLSDAGENREVLDQDYGRYEVDHNTVAIEDPVNPFNASAWANSNARGIFKGRDITGLMAPATIENVVQTPSMELASANVRINNVTGDSWDTWQTLPSYIDYERDILYPEKDYFIVIDRFNGEQPWIYRSIFRPASLNIAPSADRNNNGIYSEDEVGHINGQLTVDQGVYDWTSSPYKSERTVSLNSSSLTWETVNMYGDPVELDMYSVPASEVIVSKDVGRIAGWGAPCEVYSPVVSFRTGSTNDMYRATILLSRYTNETKKAVDTVDVKGNGNAMSVTYPDYTDTIYTGQGKSSFGSFETDANTFYARCTGGLTEYTLLSGTYLNYAGSDRLILTKKADYAVVKYNSENITVDIKSGYNYQMSVAQLSPGRTYQVFKDGILYKDWDMVDGGTTIRIRAGPGESVFEIRPVGGAI